MSTLNMDYHWLPFTNNKEFKANPQLIVRAEGIHYYDQQQRKILDACSGLFTTPAGHCRPEITEAVSKQLATLDFTPHFLRANPASFELAERIAELTPENLDRIFFVNSGSEAIETAIKIAYAFFAARGDGGKQRLVSRERAYHGVNFGGVALSGMVKNRDIYGAGLPGVAHMRHTWLAENSNTLGEGEHGIELADDLLRMIQLHGAQSIAACFVEPIAGSTGVLVPPKGYLQRLRQLCDEHDILLVFDEVITGFGRTGANFAADSFDVTPDIITMAKAITNGAQPMGAVAVRTDIYDTVIEAAPGVAPEFFHGYTWSCHPAACAAALATLNIYRDESLFERARALSPLLLDAVANLAELDIINDVRGYGMLAGFDLAPCEQPGRRGAQLQLDLFNAGLHLKTTGDAGIIAPAFVTTPQQIEQMFEILTKVLKRY
ncbi:beta-alanine--pyruvate transaminase [Sinobacterium caligoides]|uniref:Beta-alanine--pyruvate transaminase n=1 Tax=Sinobacterium caligoides TaxID=933926 RepID=A0A3N2DPI0_9GAMM|nr:aminotransferase class III-fold pyridoxal phosphate-dependent enzyme [Sinobacterium caligoides]ROS01696.1 beta-alanine--pyruvate transaminase [Sinobacterium caligoides]